MPQASGTEQNLHHELIKQGVCWRSRHSLVHSHSWCVTKQEEKLVVDICGLFKHTVGYKSVPWLQSAKASLCTLFWHSRPLGLPEVIMNGQGVHADGHSLGRYDGELFAVRTVLVELINHLLGDAFRPSASEFVDLLCVRKVRVECTELAATITE